MSLESLTITSNVLRLAPDQPLSESVAAMIAAGVECAPVCDGDKVVAVLSLGDILGDIVPVSARIEHGLTDLTFAGDSPHLLNKHLKERLALDTGVAASPAGPLTVIKANCPLLEAVFLLARRSPLPVVTEDGHLKGMVCRADLITHLIQNQKKS